jgi:AcrR family transcriptional regulator
MRLFKERGFDATAMELIAEEADIAKGTLYNYFPVKEAIIGEFMQRSFQGRYEERVLKLRNLPDTRSRMTDLLAELVAGVRTMKDIFDRYMAYRMRIMVSFHQEESEKSGFYLLGAEIIALGQQSGELRGDLSAQVLEELFEFAFIEVVKEFYADPSGFNTREAIERYTDLFMNGAQRKA